LATGAPLPAVELEELIDMFRKALDVALIGSVVMSVMSVFEEVPVLGHLGGAAEWVVWGALGYVFVRRAHDRLGALNSPNLAAFGWGSLIGAGTAVVGVLASLVAGLVLSAVEQVWAQQIGDPQGVGLATTSGVMSSVGTILSLFYWPFVGAFFCGFGGLLFSAMRVRRMTPPGTTGMPPSPTPMVFSPDGRWYWDGIRWIPVPAATAAEPPAWS
jgi:hypothetical protein